MHLLSKTGQKVRLTPLPTNVEASRTTRALRVEVRANVSRDAVSAGALVARAARGFFELGREEGRLTAAVPPPKGPPPLTFREEESGALRVVYREIVVRFAPKTPEAARKKILAKHGLVVRRKNPFVRDQVVVYHPDRKHDGARLLEIANEYTALDEVVFATPNFVSQYWRLAAPAIPTAQWHLKNKGGGGAKKDEDVRAPGAWEITTGDASIVVAVLDDGVDVDHPNLKSRIWKNPDDPATSFGRDFFLPDDDPGHFDPRPKLFKFPFDQMQGNDIHGTPCAGVIAAPGKDGGAAGVAPDCRILAVKVFHADDLAADERVADAIRYAGRHASILSCSWSSGFSNDVKEALADIANTGREGRGAVAFFAAGNSFGSPVAYPARDPNAIAVGASTDQAKLADYSNVGPEIAFVAPSSGGVRGIFTTDVSVAQRGFNIGTADAGGADGLHTNDFGGTSSATPLAAGVGALVLSVRPDLTAAQVRDVMKETCDKIGSGFDANGHSDEFGHGRVNAEEAVKRAETLS
jgi:subtilisin family serine protease